MIPCFFVKRSCAVQSIVIAASAQRVIFGSQFRLWGKSPEITEHVLGLIPRKTTGSKHDSLRTEWQFKNPGCSVLNVRLVVCSLLTPAWTLWACYRRLVGGEWRQEREDTSVLGVRWPWLERQHSGAHNRQLYDSRLAFSVSSTQWGSLLVSVDLRSYFFLSLWTLLFRSVVWFLYGVSCLLFFVSILNDVSLYALNFFRVYLEWGEMHQNLTTLIFSFFLHADILN